MNTTQSNTNLNKTFNNKFDGDNYMKSNLNDTF